MFRGVTKAVFLFFDSFTIDTLVLVQKTCWSSDILKATWVTFGHHKFLPIGHVVHVDLVGRSFCLPVPDRKHKLVTYMRKDFLASQFQSIRKNRTIKCAWPNFSSNIDTKILKRRYRVFFPLSSPHPQTEKVSDSPLGKSPNCSSQKNTKEEKS